VLFRAGGRAFGEGRLGWELPASGLVEVVVRGGFRLGGIELGGLIESGLWGVVAVQGPRVGEARAGGSGVLGVGDQQRNPGRRRRHCPGGPEP
jgi:hypothetical protein